MLQNHQNDLKKIQSGQNQTPGENKMIKHITLLKTYIYTSTSGTVSKGKNTMTTNRHKTKTKGPGVCFSLTELVLLLLLLWKPTEMMSRACFFSFHGVSWLTTVAVKTWPRHVWHLPLSNILLCLTQKGQMTRIYFKGKHLSVYFQRFVKLIK